VRSDIGVLGMKPMGDHIILDSKTASPVECLHYAMNLPTSVVITGCDSMRILDQAVGAARSFRPLKHAEVEALLAKTVQAAQAGKYEQYKTTHYVRRNIPESSVVRLRGARRPVGRRVVMTSHLFTSAAATC
jgi:hypothetical protein